MTAAERDLLLTLAQVVARLSDDAGRQIDAQDVRDNAAAVWAEAMRSSQESRR